MQFKISIERTVADERRAQIPRALQLRTKGEAIVVLERMDIVGLVKTRDGPRSGHGGCEARALLVSPRCELDLALSLDAAVVERAENLEPGQHNVIAAARDQGIPEAADDHRLQILAPFRRAKMAQT